MDVASSHSSGTGPIVHYELPTADALEAKLVVERDSASTLRDEVDMLRKQTTQSQAVLKTTIKYLVDFKTKQALQETATLPSATADGKDLCRQPRTAKGSGKEGYGKQLLCRLLPGGGRQRAFAVCGGRQRGWTAIIALSVR